MQEGAAVTMQSSRRLAVMGPTALAGSPPLLLSPPDGGRGRETPSSYTSTPVIEVFSNTMPPAASKRSLT